MNVSSVKNLNGEVLSAVQDASLTNVIQTNSGNWNTVTNKLDTSSFVNIINNFYPNDNPAGYITGVEIPESATWNEVSTTVQTNSAQWAEGGGAISSYTTDWCHDIPPYGDRVINRLNDKFISAFISNSADRANFANNANNANSANYAETVNETYVENKGFTRNLSSEYGTISVIHNNIIESTNSAISRVGNEGFVSSFEGHSIGPEYTAAYSWDKALPNTIISLQLGWCNNNFTLTYSANTNLTGEILLPTGLNTQTINIPNATEFKVWTNEWLNLDNATVSAADQFETVVGELAWASALPTYEYDNTNKISAINGSALAGGSEFPISADEAIQYVQTNSGTIDDTITNVNTNSGAWGGSALPISAGPGIKLEMVDNTLVVSTNTNGYLWQSASLFHTDTPVTQTTYTLSDNCSNYDRLDVDFYDINDWRTVMECPIPSNLSASGTRGGYFSVVPQNTSTGADIWFKAFNWTAAGTTWSCYCSELTGKGGSTAQTINANQPNNPPKVVNIIGWKRVGGN